MDYDIFKMFECYSVKLKVFLFTGIYLNLVFSTSTQILPEPLVSFDSHNSACYGPAGTHGQYRPSCSNNESVIAIQKLKVGAKPVSSGCPSIVTKVNNQIVDSLNNSNVLNETACCLPDDSVDCLLEFNYANSGLNYLYHKNSSGYTESKPNMDVIWAPTYCQEDQFHYPEATHFMFLEFSCIERTRIGNLCSTNTNYISDDAFYLYNTDYPHSVSSFIDLCQCQITTTGQSIQFYSIDIRLEKYGNECKQTLNITDSNGVTLFDCASATIFNVTKTAKTGAVTLTFKNDLPVDGGNIWIGFSSEEKETLRIECGYHIKQVTTESSTPNEVSSAAPDGTITAIQSQTSTTSTSITLTPTGSYLHQYSESDSGHFDTLSETTDTFDVTSTIIETSTKMYTSTEESGATSYLQPSLSKITTIPFQSSTFIALRTTTDTLFSTSQYTTTSVNVSNISRSPLLTKDMSSISSTSQSRTSTSIENISPKTSSGNCQTSSKDDTLSDQQTIIIKEESVATSYLESSLANKGTTTHFQSPTFSASRTTTDILFSTSQYTTNSVNGSNISWSSLLTQDMSSSSSNSQSMTSTSVETISPTTSSRNYQTSSNAGTLSDQQTIIVKDSSGLTVVYVFLGLILSVLTGAVIYLLVRKRCTDQAVQPVESNGESAITTVTSENASITSNQGDTFELNDNDNRTVSLRQSINSDESYVSIRPGAQQNVFRLPNILSRSNGSKYGNEVENNFDEINIEHENSAQPKKKYKKKKRSKKQR